MNTILAQTIIIKERANRMKRIMVLLGILLCIGTADLYAQVDTIYATANTGGTINPKDTVLIPSGTDATFLVLKDTGFHIDSVLVDNVNVGVVESYTFTNVTSNHTIAAFFSINKYTLNVVTVGTGTVMKNPDQVSYDSASTVKLTAVPGTGYHLVSWSGDTSSSKADTAWITMDGDKNVTATFAINEYTLSTTATGNGTITVDPVQATYTHGSIVQLTATPGGSSYFYRWTGDATGSSNPVNVTMDGNKSVTGAFGINIQSNGSGDWNTPATWLPVGVPTASDSVTIQGTDSIGLAAAGSCLALKLNAGTTLALNAASLTLPGSSWNFDSLSTVIYNGTTTVQSAPIYGNLTYATAGSGGPNGNLTVRNNLAITANTFRGIATVSGTVTHTIGGNVIIGPGASARLSTVNQTLATTASCTYNIGGNVLLNGNNSGNRMILYESAGPHSGSAVININGNLQIGTTTGSGSQIQFKSSSATSQNYPEGIINMKGNLVQYGTIGVNSVSSGTSPGLSLNFVGTSEQDWSGGGAFSVSGFSIKVNIDNTASVKLSSPRSISTNTIMMLTSGKVTTSSSNLLTITGTGTLSGGNSSSYIDGPVTHTIETASPTTKKFPIGKGSAYRPVEFNVNQDAATSTTYTAELFNAAPTSRTLPTSLLSVSNTRYVTVTKGSGANISPTQGATIQLSYGVDDSVSSALLARVAIDSSTIWKNLGGTGTADNIGTITSQAFFELGTHSFVLAVGDTSAPKVAPTVTTMAMSKISTTFASSGGNVINDGGAEVTARGVCWNMTGTPTIADSTTSDGTGSGVFNSHITGLSAGQTYYLCAYATNVKGTSYGAIDTFQTLAAIVPPTVTTSTITNILVTSASSGGNVIAWGGDSVTARGVCWNTTGSPTISDSYSTNGSDIGTFTSSMYPLVGNTKYYVRAYATNGVGTGYGDTVSFTTQTPAPDTTVVVAKDGSGDYTTVQAAFRAVPTNYTGKWKIFVKKGAYFEKDTLAAGKINVILEGEDRDSTTITSDEFADRAGGTSSAFTIAIDASDFIAKNITFQNTYWPNRYGPASGTQGVALRTQGDRQEYINCRFLGYQDTYYTWGGSGTGRMYHKNCYIEGTVDFIFGRNICVFDSCTISEIRNNSPSLTAGGTDASSQYGYVFRNCIIRKDTISASDTTGFNGGVTGGNGSNTTFYLGRPWQGSPRTVFMRCYEPAELNVAGWLPWNVTPALYGEYSCYGPGSSFSLRSTNPPSSQLTLSDALNYTLEKIFAKASATSNLITYDWMPVNAKPEDNYPITGADLAQNIQKAIPNTYSLSQNYPNPFNPTTTINYDLPKTGKVSLKVYDVYGREVATLVNGIVAAGTHQAVFDAKKLASGVYFARIQTEVISSTIKLVLVK
jgi:pectin methylesterase-like acyl-CoA thioesterase